MKNILKACIALMVMGFIFCGCKKDEDKDSIYLVTDITYDGDYVVKIAYDSQNRITKVYDQ